MVLKLFTLVLAAVTIQLVQSDQDAAQQHIIISDRQTSYFDLELLQRMATSGRYNILVSPLSLKLLLAMIMEGAVDETASEIQRALRLPQDQDLARNETRKWMSAFNIKSEGSNIVKVANRIFLDHFYTVKGEYRSAIQQYYNADVTSVRKENPGQTAQTINDWVNRETSGLIPSIISPNAIHPRTFVMAEGNAVYFKGTWKYPFQPNYTKKDCFYKFGHFCERIDMMNMYKVPFLYGFLHRLNAKAISIPYKDETHSMLIVLPNKGNGIYELVRNIKHYSMDFLTMSLYKSKSVTLRIPKFEIEFENKEVVPTLRSMNISRIFSKSAQLYNMVNEKTDKLYVSEIMQKTKIIVNEEGTEAAAASVGVIVVLSGEVHNPVLFIADHPFLYFIIDKNNNVLFAGKYDGP